MMFLLGYIPFFLFFLSIFFLQENVRLLLIYVIGYLANELLNRVLKPIIRDPRPVPFSPTDKFGMPSGHAQLSAFSLVFMSLVLQEKRYAWILLFLCLTLVSMAQRVIIKAHTLEQVIVGALLGGVLGYLTYGLIGKNNIMVKS
jgi:membrane-associated phospholipid phosphatase